jgi:hypothetical protein
MNFTVTRISPTGFKVTKGPMQAFVSYEVETDTLKVLSGKLFDNELAILKNDIKRRIKLGF